MMERANLGAFALELRIRLGREPAAHEMWFEVGLFTKKRPTEPCEMLSTTPRLTASRASSLWLQ